MNTIPAGFLVALRTLYSPEPVTDADRAEHKRLVAAQAARDEAKRSGDQPQRAIDLEDAA